jgi:hypothetical protein
VAFYQGQRIDTHSWQFHFVRSTTPEEAEKACHQQIGKRGRIQRA